jgi:hypothetical protein
MPAEPGKPQAADPKPPPLPPTTQNDGLGEGGSSPPADPTWFDKDFSDDAQETDSITTSFGKVTRKELQEVLGNLRQRADDNGREASTALRQLCLGGLAVAWLYKLAGPSTAGMVELPPDLLWPIFFLIAGLAADAVYWGVNAVYWGLDKRFHLRYKLTHFDNLGMSLLTQTERIHGIAAPRPRFAPYLIGMEVAFTFLGLFLLLRFLMNRTLF